MPQLQKKNKFLNKVQASKPVVVATSLLKRIVLPGFDGLCLYDVGGFFIRGIQKDAIAEKSAGISYNFFMAIFPGIIFLFTLIPYLPIENFQSQFFVMLQGFLPEKASKQVIDVVLDITSRPRGGLMSIGILFTLYFSTNGINSMIASFNRTYYTVESRGVISQRLVSIFLFVVLTVMIVFCIGLIVGSHLLFNYFETHNIVLHAVTVFLLNFAEFIVIVAFCFFCISFLYYFAPAKKVRYRFFSAGGTLATILILLISQGFNFYVNNFTKYNILYGSIGTLIIFMLWIYFNAMIILIGFELNVSIRTAIQKKNNEVESISKL